MESEISKILFIINPILEKRLGIRVKDLVDENLDPGLFEPSIVYSDYPGHARELALGSLDRYHVIVAGGGDGTVNEIAQPVGPFRRNTGDPAPGIREKGWHGHLAYRWISERPTNP